MVFIDGTNLFSRLDSAKLNLNENLYQIIAYFLDGRQIVRIYLYTILEQIQKTLTFHGNYIKTDIRVVYGEGIPTGDGNIKEKCVDALLVADLIYHAAVKNFDYALVVSTDTDFVKALHRVEYFGCRTGVLAICSDMPDRLRDACDEPKSCLEEQMINEQWAVRRPN